MDKVRILIVEDENIIALHIKTLLENYEFEVLESVRRGEDAVSRIPELKPDLVLMDIILEGPMDGITAAQKIREMYGIPVVYLTAHADIATVTRARETEPFGYVLKPVSPLDLFSTIDTALHRYRLQNELKQKTAALVSANRLLAEREEQYRNLFRMASDALFLVDCRSGKILDANSSAEKLYGYTRDELGEILLGDISLEPEFKEEAAGDFRSGPSIQWHRKKDSSIFPVEITSNTFTLQDRPVLLVAARDVTERTVYEEAIKRTQERYRLFLTNFIGIAYQTVYKSFKPTFFYGTVEEITGYEADEFMSDRLGWDRIIHPDDIDLVIRERMKFETVPGFVADMQYRIIHKSGSIRWVRDIGRMITDLTGGSMVQGAIYDITERKEAEEELKLTLEATDQGVWSWDFRNNTFSSSPRYYAMLGYEQGKFPPTLENLEKLVHPDDLPQARSMTMAFMKSESDMYNNEFRIKTGNGEYRWLRIKGRVVKRDRDGSAVKMIGSHEDITEQKLAEDSLSLMKIALENVSESIFWINEEGKFIYVNGPACWSLGYSREELLAMGVSDMDKDFSADKWKDQWIEIGKAGSINLETRLKTRDGSVIPVEITGNYIRHGDVELVFAFVRDSTRRKPSSEEIKK